MNNASPNSCLRKAQQQQKKPQRETAMKMLKSKLLDLKEQEQKEKIEEKLFN